MLLYYKFQHFYKVYYMKGLKMADTNFTSQTRNLLSLIQEALGVILGFVALITAVGFIVVTFHLSSFGTTVQGYGISPSHYIAAGTFSLLVTAVGFTIVVVLIGLAGILVQFIAPRFSSHLNTDFIFYVIFEKIPDRLGKKNWMKSFVETIQQRKDIIPSEYLKLLADVFDDYHNQKVAPTKFYIKDNDKVEYIIENYSDVKNYKEWKADISELIDLLRKEAPEEFNSDDGFKKLTQELRGARQRLHNLKQWRMIRIVFFTFFILSAISVSVSIFATHIYPKLPFALGGGDTVHVILFFESNDVLTSLGLQDESPASSVQIIDSGASRSKSVELLAELVDGVLVRDIETGNVYSIKNELIVARSSQ